jgi:HYR domain
VRASGETIVTDMTSVDFAPAISGDGNAVAFTAHLVDNPARRQIFVYDRLAGTTELASVGTTGEAGASDSDDAAISGDGGLVAFRSAAWNLVDGVHGGVFVRERVDRSPPTLTVPGPLVVEGAGPSGARVSYVVSARDAADPNPSVSCWPASGSLFPLGQTTVTCTATDASGNSATASFAVTVTAALPPVTFQPAPGCKAAWSAMTAVTAAGVRSSAAATALAVSPSDAWAIRRTSSGGPMRWDGTTWTTATAAVTGPVAVDARTAVDAWIVANDQSSHYDGAAWTAVPVATGAGHAYLAAVEAIAPDDVWAVGKTFKGSPSTAIAIPVVEHWDGVRWSIVPSPSPASLGHVKGELLAVRALAPNDLWAAGSVDDQTLIEHWDGTRWSVVAAPDGASTPSELRALAAISPDDVWAVGRTGQAPSQPLVEHWDGTRWSVGTAQAPAAGQDALLTGVAAVSPTDVWASGSVTNPGATNGMLFLEHWDGTAWSLIETAASTIRTYGGIAALPTGAVLAAATNVQQLCEARVRDAGVLPSKTSSGFGTTLAWSIDPAAAQPHSVTDGSGMGLFDSGLRAPGGSFTYSFPAAGTYKLTDSATGHASTVSVAMTATPRSGTLGTSFAIGWAAAGPPPGYAYDVQVRRPGTTAYADVQPATSEPSATFTPDAGAGTYYFRSRLRNTNNGASSGWSSPKPITVS